MDKLQKLLRGNGTFSAGSGLILLAGSPWLDVTFGLQTWLLAVVGVGLIAYGIQIFQMANATSAIAGGKFATAMDLGWVIGAALILLAFPTAMTAAGRVVLLIATLVVAALAAGQATALRRVNA